MDNLDLAAQVIRMCAMKGYSTRRIAESLADYGLLSPDLPASDLSFPSGEKEWGVIDGYVNLDGDILVAYDERDEDAYMTEPAPEPCQIRITDTTQGRYLSYSTLAACDMKDAQDAQL